MPIGTLLKGQPSLHSNPGNYVSAQDFGLAVSDGSCFPLIQDGQQIHINREQHHYFGLVEDSQEAPNRFRPINRCERTPERACTKTLLDI